MVIIKLTIWSYLEGHLLQMGFIQAFILGHEDCSEQSVLAQWIACFHLIGLGIELTARFLHLSAHSMLQIYTWND
ncbi:unnamed protein product [Blepharisma stoltei]|uniref:Uncharacterized protein n=1 Tax=Blepharisma stoltei TaxID=1481888 RepID=A0AAU9JY66_9CILI|nr:unnamed protein product [Blepharisma stoltei]